MTRATSHINTSKGRIRRIRAEDLFSARPALSNNAHDSLVGGQVEQLLCRLVGRLRMRLVKPSLDMSVDLHVTRVAKRQHVVEGVVPLLLRISHPAIIDVMDVRCLGASAEAAGEVVSLQGFKVIPVSVLGDELSQEGAAGRAVPMVLPGSLNHRAADSAGEIGPARTAGLIRHVAWMKLLIAAVARLRVKLGLRVLVSKLANFAAELKFVVSTKFRRTRYAVSVSKGSFGHTEIYLNGGF